MYKGEEYQFQQVGQFQEIAGEELPEYIAVTYTPRRGGPETRIIWDAEMHKFYANPALDPAEADDAIEQAERYMNAHDIPGVAVVAPRMTEEDWCELREDVLEAATYAEA